MKAFANLFTEALAEDFGRNFKRLCPHKAFAVWSEPGLDPEAFFTAIRRKIPGPARDAAVRWLHLENLTAEAGVAALAVAAKDPGLVVVCGVDRFLRRGAADGAAVIAAAQKMFTTSKSKAHAAFLLTTAAAALDAARAEEFLTHALRLTPLRERPLELQLRLQRYFHEQGLAIDRLALTRLCAYDWPGNEAELHNVLQMLGETKTTITIDELPIPVPVASGDALYPQDRPPALRR